jgi:hypothetical protein
MTPEELEELDTLGAEHVRLRDRMAEIKPRLKELALKAELDKVYEQNQLVTLTGFTRETLRTNKNTHRETADGAE